MKSSIIQIDLSVVIITLNEGDGLRRCLRSLPQGIQLIVVDSGSTDNTERVCKEFGAEFHQRVFDNYASQKNHALSFANRDWVLSLDGDEALDAKMTSQILDIVNETPKLEAFRLKRCLVFLGKQMKFGKSSDYPIRLFPKGSAKFVGEIHEKLVFEKSTSIKSLSTGCVHHYSYDSLEDYFTKFNEYTTKIAESHYQKNSSIPSVIALCCRPLGEFFYRYIFRLGILDGYPGYCYALISSFYSFIKYAKLKELDAGSSTGDLDGK